jgi:hypothetical protein
MITAALLVLGCALAVGIALAARSMREDPERSRRIPLAGAAHGLAGLIGLGLLVLTLDGPPRGVTTGTSDFGLAAATVIGIGALVGLLLPSLSRKGVRGVGVVMAIHGGLAITGFTLLLAWVGLG